MRILATTFALFVVACGGGSGGGDTAVTDLSNAEQITLCQNFLDDICAQAEFESFCSDPCITAGCQPAVEGGQVDGECDFGPDNQPITSGDVASCGSTGDMAVCLEGGGCMFDALEAACP
jgi:hypothetical protein